MRQRDPVLNDARRGEILAAASRSFVERGFHATTMQDVSRAAGLGVSTIYHYFPSKADIVAGIIAEDRRQTQDLLAAAAGGGDFFDGLFRVLDVLGGLVTDHDLALHTEVSAEILRDPALRQTARDADAEMRATLAAAIARAQAAGEVDRRLDPAGAALLVAALLDGVLWHATMQGVSGLAERLPGVKQALARMLADPDGMA